MTALLDDLALQGIRYCVWKSNSHLRAALAGETDLDLLVDRTQADRFRQTLARHGVKPIVPPARAAYPGVEHALGFDEGSGRLFHLHVHYQLVLGERYVKNYRIPLEQRFLSTTRRLEGVPVPPAALELAVLALRALLKYRARDVIKDVLNIRSPGVPVEIQDEIAWLLPQTNASELSSALCAAGDGIPTGLICELLDIVTRRPRSGYRFLRLRARLRRELRGFRRHGRLRTWMRQAGGIWDGRRRTARGLPGTRMTLPGGGLAVGLVGVDGAGKSTLAATVTAWLGWKLEAATCYLGSKAPSRRSRWLYLSFRALRRSTRAIGRRFGAGAALTRGVASARDLALALHHLSIGRDRARRYATAIRQALNGWLVVFDRFPMETLGTTPEHRLLDGPQIAAALPGSASPIIRALAAREERMYRRFRLPDILFLLQATPEVAFGRKPDHDPEVLRAKSRALLGLGVIAETSAAPGRVVRLDADRSLDAVLADLKKRLWDVL